MRRAATKQAWRSLSATNAVLSKSAIASWRVIAPGMIRNAFPSQVARASVSLMSSRSFATGDYPPHLVLDMPALSPTMDSGTLVSWDVKVGDEVEAGSVIAKVETDKATIDFEIQDDGYVAKLLVPDGTADLEVGTPVIVLAEDEADVAAFKDFEASGAPAPAEAPEPAAPKKAPEPAAPKQAPAPAAPKQAPAPAAPTGGRIAASPLARVAAKEKGVDLSAVSGTGPGNRILAADVDEFTPAAQALFGANYEEIPVSGIRRIIAERLTESKQTIPHYYLTVECEMDEVMELRAALNKEGGDDFKLSVNDFIVKASAIALRKVPECNSSWGGNVIRKYNSVDINVAVSADGALYTPLVSHADLRGLSSISNKVRTLAGKARDKKISPEELASGTFTISNLGMFGISHFSAVINPPQACILAVGGTQDKVVVDTSDSDDKFRVAKTMAVTLSCDHRVVDGAVGAQWLKVFKDLMENPTKMLL